MPRPQKDQREQYIKEKLIALLSLSINNIIVIIIMLIICSIPNPSLITHVI